MQQKIGKTEQVYEGGWVLIDGENQGLMPKN